MKMRVWPYIGEKNVHNTWYILSYGTVDIDRQKTYRLKREGGRQSPPLHVLVTVPYINRTVTCRVRCKAYVCYSRTVIRSVSLLLDSA